MHGSENEKWVYFLVHSSSAKLSCPYFWVERKFQASELTVFDIRLRANLLTISTPILI
jgi:hypothetical protein